MKQYILITIALVAISVFNAEAGNKVANSNQPKTYIDKLFANIEPENNVIYLHSYVQKHISSYGRQFDCMDTVRVFKVNDYEVFLNGNYSSDTHTSPFRWKCDANLLKGRKLNIVKIQLPAQNVTCSLHDITPIDEIEIVVRFDTYTNGKEELRAIKINRLTGEISETGTEIDKCQRRYHGGRCLDVNWPFAEMHTAKDSKGNNCLVAIWR